MVAPLILANLLPDIDACSVAEGQYGFGDVIPGRTYLVLGETKVFFAHLLQFDAYLFEVAAEADDFLQACEASDVVEAALIIEEEVAHLVGLLLEVLSEKRPHPIVETVHATCILNDQTLTFIDIPGSNTSVI